MAPYTTNYVVILEEVDAALFPYIVRYKWHMEKRNLQVGDVVLVKDTNIVRGLWKLAQVSEVSTGRDGKVHNVFIRYKNQGPGAEY